MSATSMMVLYRSLDCRRARDSRLSKFPMSMSSVSICVRDQAKLKCGSGFASFLKMTFLNLYDIGIGTHQPAGVCAHIIVLRDGCIPLILLCFTVI